MAIVPQGVRFNKQQTEFQLFPEEYFTGTDCTVYFGDVWVDDLTGLQFTLVEKVAPVQGYADKTWAYVKRGKRYVEGTFRLAFREAGYLYTIFDHIGQLDKAKPGIAYLLNGQPIPKWHGSAKQRIEQVIAQWQGSGANASTAGSTTTRIVPRWTEDVLKEGMQGESVRQLQQALKEKGHYSGTIDGIFGPATKAAVIAFEKKMGYPEGADGIVGIKVRQDLGRAETVSVPGSTNAARDPNLPAEDRMAQYEKEIWGRDFVEGGEDVRNLQSYFYRGRTTDVNGMHTQRLFQQGIDIYVNYGPLPEAIARELDKVMKNGTLSFSTTVKALRNVQLTGVSQVLDANTGAPIEEVYTFIARDLD